MSKFLGMIFLLTGFGGLAFEKVKEKKKEIDHLSEIKKFSTYLLREIEYSHIPIPDICKEYINRSEGIIRAFLERVYIRYEKNSGKSFDSIWDEEIVKYQTSWEVKKMLEGLGKTFGFSNLGMQMSSIQQFIQEIEQLILQKEKNYTDNRKLILYFGVMSGLLLSIILL